MKNLKLMNVNGVQREIAICPAFIQIVEDANSMFCLDARSMIITNILDDYGKKITYLVKETPDEICDSLTREGIKLLNFTCVNGMTKRVFIRNYLIINVEDYNDVRNTSAHSKIYTNLSDNNGGMFKYVAAETKEEINNRISQLQKI